MRWAIGLYCLIACAETPQPTHSVELTPNVTTIAPSTVDDASIADASIPDTAPAVDAAVADVSLPPSANGLSISLERTVCYGVCPSYVVTLQGDGTVLYEGRQFVKTKGKKTDKVSPSDVAALLAKLDRAGFDKLHVDDKCTMISTDHPTVTITVVRDGHKHVVEHYTGNSCAPKVLTSLEDAIDAVAGTDRWVPCGVGSAKYCHGP